MGNVHMEATQINYREGGTKMSVAQAIKNAGSEITPEEKTWIDSIPALTTSNAGKTDQDVIAPEFDAESGVYAVGDKVMYEGKLYEFTTAHETPGDWDSSEVSETTVADELNSLESGLNDVNSNITTLGDRIYSGISWSGSQTYALNQDKWYVVMVGKDGSNANFDVLYAQYSTDTWIIIGSNVFGVTFSGDNLVIPQYVRATIISS